MSRFGRKRSGAKMTTYLKSVGTTRLGLFDQDVYWVDRLGVRRRVENMTPNHRRAWLNWADRNALRFARVQQDQIEMELCRDLPDGVWNSLSSEAGMWEMRARDEQSAREWMRSTSLYRQIHALVEEDDISEALSTDIPYAI